MIVMMVWYLDDLGSNINWCPACTLAAVPVRFTHTRHRRATTCDILFLILLIPGSQWCQMVRCRLDLC